MGTLYLGGTPIYPTITSGDGNAIGIIYPISEGKKPLPYTELTYIESTSWAYNSNYIDTGFKPNNNTKIELKGEGHYTNDSWDRWYGSSDLFRMEMFRVSGGKDAPADFWFNRAKSNQTLFADRPNVIIQDKNVLYINGEKKNTFANANFQDTDNLRLFSASTGDRDGILKMYYCKVYDDGVLIRDFIPVKMKSDGRIGMWDKVDNKFYENKGTIPFVAGDIKQ